MVRDHPHEHVHEAIGEPVWGATYDGLAAVWAEKSSKM